MQFIYHHRTRGKAVEGVHIRGIADGLTELGHRVSIVGPPGVEIGAEESWGGTAGAPGWKSRAWAAFSRACPEPLFELMEIGYSLAAYPRLVRACKRAQADAIYERYAFFNAAGMLAARSRRIPLLLEVNDSVEVERERRGHSLMFRGVARRIEQSVFRSAAGLFVVSNYLRDLLVDRGIDASKIVVTPNAIDPVRFDPETAGAAAVRERLGLQGRVVIGFVGSFLSWHGIELLMRVVPRILDRHPSAAFLLVGDGARRGPAEEQVAAAGLRDRVRFTGHVPHAEVPGYIATMDVGLMPHSNRFGSPVKIFEYMALGIVPVGPRLGPLQEAIEEDVNGLLFEPENEDALFDTLSRLASDEVLRKRLGTAARQRVLERHLWVHNSERIASLAAESTRAAAARRGASKAAGRGRLAPEPPGSGK